MYRVNGDLVVEASGIDEVLDRADAGEFGPLESPVDVVEVTIAEVLDEVGFLD